MTLEQMNSQRKLWSSGRALGSRSEGRGFDTRPMLDGSGVNCQSRARIDSYTPNYGLLHIEKNKKKQVAKWGTPKIYLKKIEQMNSRQVYKVK